MQLPQFGVGSVFVTHAPLSQTSPPVQSVDVVHCGTQEPSTHLGVLPEHCASLMHCEPPVGSQTPFTHCVPAAHIVVPLLQSTRHSPFAHTLPAPHSLEYWQTFATGSHFAQLPLPTHCCPDPQSLFDVQMTVCGGGSVEVGATQTLFLQTSPFAQSVSTLQTVSQPAVVQTWFAAQED